MCVCVCVSEQVDHTKLPNVYIDIAIAIDIDTDTDIDIDIDIDIDLDIDINIDIYVYIHIHLYACVYIYTYIVLFNYVLTYLLMYLRMYLYLVHCLPCHVIRYVIHPEPFVHDHNDICRRQTNKLTDLHSHFSNNSNLQRLKTPVFALHLLRTLQLQMTKRPSVGQLSSCGLEGLRSTCSLLF